MWGQWVRLWWPRGRDSSRLGAYSFFVARRAYFPRRESLRGRRSKRAMDTVRVLLADDHALVRLGFRGLLRGLSGVEVVAEAGDGREALELIRRLRPDLALVDIAMPGL